ncbi:FAD-dependent oxidoreductase [Streptomyces sp. NPDC056930]|uniref:FAD-dependent oxidoreductase n=1 Tax=Streptomyces sp. NPDC056930 TaxID=3345967 RepID=UPI003639076F
MRVAVVGSGALGAAVADELVRRGLSVVVCTAEESRPPATDVAFGWLNSHGSAAEPPSGARDRDDLARSLGVLRRHGDPAVARHHHLERRPELGVDRSRDGSLGRAIGSRRCDRRGGGRKTTYRPNSGHRPGRSTGSSVNCAAPPVQLNLRATVGRSRGSARIRVQVGTDKEASSQTGWRKCFPAIRPALPRPPRPVPGRALDTARRGWESRQAAPHTPMLSSPTDDKEGRRSGVTLLQRTGNRC